ncbi:MAG: hypothetical protein JOZ62_01120, partial [Acidobacteriaceae bacterium]|nr:hypothetical protein [Acidobacteriaceae bacterium]
MATTVWRGFVTFGLISIPVRLFRAARSERVSLRRLYRAAPPLRQSVEEPVSHSVPDYAERDHLLSDSSGQRRTRLEGLKAAPAPEPIRPATPAPLTPVQQVSIRKGTDEILPDRSVVKGYEYEKDRFVVVEREELKSIAPKTATEMEIHEFVK